MSRRITVIATGGTISTAPGAAGAEPVLGADELLGATGQNIDALIRTRDMFRLSSRAIGPEQMWELASAVHEEIASADGVVITHGTDTIEETAYALALLVDTRVPVVLTGAMRVPAEPGADGPANLAAAISVASCEAFAAFGPVVVLHDEVHSARWVTKLHSSRVAAFASPVAGPVGAVIEGVARPFLGPPTQSERLPKIAPPAKRVELVVAVAGADGMLVDAIADRVDGLVVAGTGGGHVAPPLADALIRLARSGRPVVLSSRSAASVVLSRTYGGAGSETHLLSEGLLSAGTLSALKARIRLCFGLSAGIPAADLFPRD